MAVAILCSLKCKIKRKVNRNKCEEFFYYEAFKKEKDFAKSFKSVHLLSLNKEISGLTEYGSEILNFLKGHGNDFSHPNFRNTLLMIPKTSFKNKLYFGSSFDPEREEDYRNELFVRIKLCEKTPDLIDKLILNIKLL